MTAAGFLASARSAGRIPVAIPARTATPRAKAMTRASTPISLGTLAPQTLGRAKYELSRALRGPAAASATPPASTERWRLSMRSCRTRRPREAPMAARRASSRWRLAPVTRTRLATLAHARRRRHAAARIMIRVVAASASRVEGLIQVAGSSVKTRRRLASGASRSRPAASAATSCRAASGDSPAPSRTRGITAAASRFTRVSDRAQ